MRHWTHGHSMAAGVAGGLLLAGHTIELVTVAAVVAFAAGYFTRQIRHGAAELAHRLSVRMGHRPPGYGTGARRRRPPTQTPRIRIAGVLDRVGRMLRDDEEIPF